MKSLVLVLATLALSASASASTLFCTAMMEDGATVGQEVPVVDSTAQITLTVAGVTIAASSVSREGYKGSSASNKVTIAVGSVKATAEGAQLMTIDTAQGPVDVTCGVRR